MRDYIALTWQKSTFTMRAMTNEIIEKYEALALDNDMSLVELAREAGIAASTISRWRDGRKPRGETLRKLARRVAALEAVKAGAA